jgi:ribosome-binding protein aMBF1 (putative translation factor)
MNRKAEKYYSPIIEKLMAERDSKQTAKVKKRMMLAAKIDDGIKAKGWKKKDLAEALNKQPSEITKWLSGTHNFTSDTLWDIEDVLDIELISLADKKQEQVTYYYLTVSQKPETKSSDSIIINDLDELIPTLSKSFKI